MRASLAAVLVCLIGGCDSRATASDPGGRAELKSKEYETCSASAQCGDELRCFEHACRRTARSTVGDYFAALGHAARGKGDAEAAVSAYAQAITQYDGEKLAVPPDVDCAYGAALAAAKANKEHAELAARVLHRCVLAVPVGSALRAQAIGELAGLADAGLDPSLLAASKLADRYLTRAASAPAADKLAVTVTASPAPTGKSFALVPAKLADAEVRSALVACWTAYNAASHKPALAVTIGVKATYIASDYEDEPGTFAVRLDPPAGADPAEACVRQVVEPAIKGLKIADAFATRLTIAIK